MHSDSPPPEWYIAPDPDEEPDQPEQIGDLMDSDEQLTLLGYACVDSGQLMITDPCYVRGKDADDDERLPLNKLAVTFSDFGGDGRFPVYAVKYDGQVCRVIIDLLGG